MQDVTVTVLNAFYRHLLEHGRCKPNNNATMFQYWKAKTKGGKEISPRELASACKTTIYAARAAIRRYRAGRLPRDLGTGLAPKTVRNVQNMMHKILGTAVAWHYLEHNRPNTSAVPESAGTARKPGTPRNWARSSTPPRRIDSVRCGCSSPRRECGVPNSREQSGVCSISTRER
jgi:hypothetical protein